jgi:lipoyl(octanoyl) transferase
MSPGQELDIRWLGSLPYGEALKLQLETVEARARGAARDQLLLLEHPPVITLGRGAAEDNLLVSAEELAERGIELHRVQRGGDITYHGPGQLVGYLIADLQRSGPPDVHDFLRRLESALIDALATLGVPAHRVEGLTGVYVDPEDRIPRRKIASIGVGVKQWISFHGFALNVCMDLRDFDLIIPCGLREVVMTSIAEEISSDHAGLPEGARRAVSAAFGRAFA